MYRLYLRLIFAWSLFSIDTDLCEQIGKEHNTSNHILSGNLRMYFHF